MSPNRYTQDFHDSVFPGWHVSNTAWDYHNFWFRRDVPWLELPLNLDTTQTLQELQSEHDYLFDEISEQVNNKLDAQARDRLWFMTPHQYGWQSCVISRRFYPKAASQIEGTEFPPQVIEPKLHPDTAASLIQQLHDLGIEIFWVDVKALAPGGWIQPHVDVKTPGTSTMEYFWIPINHCKANFKSWPMGQLYHSVGNMYLVNNQDFLHSVINHDPWTRYVLTGRIDKDSLPDTLRHTVAACFQQQWC